MRLPRAIISPEWENARFLFVNRLDNGLSCATAGVVFEVAHHNVELLSAANLTARNRDGSKRVTLHQFPHIVGRLHDDRGPVIEHYQKADIPTVPYGL